MLLLLLSDRQPFFSEANCVILIDWTIHFLSANGQRHNFGTLYQPTQVQNKLEDLTVLKRSPDLLNNVKIGQDQLRLIMKHILFNGGYGHFG